MDIMKREIKIFISVVLLMLVGASAVFAATKDDIVEPLRVHNEGFEEPVVTNNNKYDQLDMGKVPYWQSTAFEGKIELFIKNTGTYIKPNVTLVPRAGSQAAELNADEASTLYQYVYGAPGSVYEWGVSHRARYDADDNNKGDKDTMAIFIGPKQPVDPAKTAKGGKDQFMKTVDWLNDNKLLDLNVADLDYPVPFPMWLLLSVVVASFIPVLNTILFIIGIIVWGAGYADNDIRLGNLPKWFKSVQEFLTKQV